jgi:hypothetical protein
VARWWWPTLAVASFLAIAIYVTGHDPGLSQRGLVTIALAALVVVLLTIHRTAGPSRLARAAAEYTIVALLAACWPSPPPATSSRSAPPPRARPSNLPPPELRPARTVLGCSGLSPAGSER